MRLTICRFQCAASWFFCALIAGLSPCGFAQVLPPLYPVSVPNFTIPFEVGSGESANAIREVELLVSKDRGKRWHSVARQPIEAEKFAFRADSDGEHWFAFRTITLNGNMSPMNGQPQLRVLVNTKDPTMAVSAPQSSEPGRLTPPKPERFRNDNAPKPPLTPLQQTAPQQTPSQQTKDDEPIIDKPQPEKTNAEEPLLAIIGPELPGLELPEQGKNREGDILDELLSGMSPFLDVQPVAALTPLSRQVAVEKQNIATPAGVPAGGITSIDLNDKEMPPQIIVRWNPGDALWQDAQIDILRSSTKEGQRIPIAINLRNDGEYWWFLSPEDLKPFYVTVRIRSLHGIHSDVTHTAIEIEPRLAMLQHQRP
jgi:hypothetical protein